MSGRSRIEAETTGPKYRLHIGLQFTPDRVRSLLPTGANSLYLHWSTDRRSLSERSVEVFPAQREPGFDLGLFLKPGLNP